MKEFKAPTVGYEQSKIKVFLAGSIEMGTAEDWQTKFTKLVQHLDITILNPRRDDWDSSWTQSIENKQFYEQVNWELTAMENSDIIVFYFSPGTKSPITLMELGLHVNNNHSPKIYVCCPDGFWRKGNVDIVCTRNNIQCFTNIDDAIGALRTRIAMEKAIRNSIY